MDPDDRRARTLHLTERGRSLAGELGIVTENLQKHALASVTAADGEAAVRALQGLERAAEEMLRYGVASKVKPEEYLKTNGRYAAPWNQSA